MILVSNLCKVVTVIYFVSKYANAYSGNISKNSTNKNWCITKTSNNGKKLSCKFQCWKTPNIFLPFENEKWRNSIDSLNLQVIDQNCSYEVDFKNIQTMNSLQTFVLSGHLKTFNLSALLIAAPKLENLLMPLTDLNVLFMEKLSQTNLKSIFLFGKFDPKKWQFLKSSEKTLRSFSLILNRKIFIPENLFANMQNIEMINLQIVSEKISSHSFFNLSKLTHLHIHNNNYHTPMILQKYAFSNLPVLESLKITNFDIDYNGTSNEFCNEISENIYHFVLEGSSLLFVERCSKVWKCTKCGIPGSKDIQTMEFKSLLTNNKSPNNSNLDDILPNPDGIYYLNTTRLILIDTHITAITSTSLVRFPLLTHYHHHRSWRLHDNSKIFNTLGDIDKFNDNPFETLLNNRSKLTEVKLSIAICDCVSYDVYRFLIKKNVSVFFYCRNLVTNFNLASTDSWIFHDVYINLMNQKCSGNYLLINLGFICSCLFFSFRFY